MTMMSHDQMMGDVRCRALQAAMAERHGLLPCEVWDYVTAHYPSLVPLLSGFRCDDRALMADLGIVVPGESEDAVAAPYHIRAAAARRGPAAWRAALRRGGRW